jgi:Uma2 family endonuclease
MAIEVERRVFTVDEYDRLIETGFFRPDERLELVDGEIVTMSPIGTRHAACVGRLTDLLGARLGRRALVWVQNPVVLGERDEFQPDVAVLRRRDDYYATARPGPSDVLLLIEVADTTLTYDRSVKVPRYGVAGVPEVWLVDLQRDVVLVYETPTADGYAISRTGRRGEQLVPISLPDVQLDVDEILG